MTTLYAEYEPIALALARVRHVWRRTY